jgi:tetratricopeptide (TPR) repeat protein
MARPKAGREAANRTAMTVQFNSVDQALRKAKALSKKGSVGEAQAAYRWVLENFPNNKRALEGLQALGTSRAPNGSSRELTQDQAQALIALYKQGRIAEALQKAQALAVLHPDVVFLNNFLGVCNTALGRPETGRSTIPEGARDGAPTPPTSTPIWVTRWPRSTGQRTPLPAFSAPSR